MAGKDKVSRGFGFIMVSERKGTNEVAESPNQIAGSYKQERKEQYSGLYYP
jgi:hypothetical protein